MLEYFCVDVGRVYLGVGELLVEEMEFQIGFFVRWAMDVGYFYVIVVEIIGPTKTSILLPKCQQDPAWGGHLDGGVEEYG